MPAPPERSKAESESSIRHKGGEDTMWRTILHAVIDFLLYLLAIPCLLLGVLCLIIWLTAVVVVTGTWITAVAAVTGVIGIVAALPIFVFNLIVGLEKERMERGKRGRTAEKKCRAARASTAAPDHAAPEHQ